MDASCRLYTNKLVLNALSLRNSWLCNDCLTLKQVIHITIVILQRKRCLEHDCVVTVTFLSTYKHKAFVSRVPFFFPRFFILSCSGS